MLDADLTALVRGALPLAPARGPSTSFDQERFDERAAAWWLAQPGAR